MTYCVGIKLKAGLVFLSDSRTNAGVDNVSSFRKMKVFERPGDRCIAIMTSGNLSITQNALNLLELQSRRDDPQGNIWIGGNGGPDSHILKFTKDGKFLMQIGKKGARRKEGAKAGGNEGDVAGFAGGSNETTGEPAGTHSPTT